jgi:hypothetical protein
VRALRGDPNVKLLVAGRRKVPVGDYIALDNPN